MKTNPLDQLKGICEQALSSVAKLNKSFKKFIIETMIRYLYKGPKQKKPGRPKKFDGKVNVHKPREGVFATTTVDDGGTLVTLHYAKLYAVCLKRIVGVVIAVYDDPEKKTQTRKVFFSTDLALSGEQIYLVYRSRFSIEFLYRDGKQFTSLTGCQARNRKSLNFAFNASFSSVNIAKTFAGKLGLDLSVESVKLLTHNAVMIHRIISTFGKSPNLNLDQQNSKNYCF